MLSHLSAPNAGPGKTPEHRSRKAQRKTRQRAHCVLCLIAVAIKIHELGAKVNFARNIFCPVQFIKPMFERFSERARRVIFFARYEASQYGSNTIEIEHLLLGALKEDRDLIKRFSGTSTTAENIRTEIEKHLTLREKVSTSVDLPLSEACKRVLTLALNECVALNHPHVEVEHILLGILRQQASTASQIL